MKSKSKQARVPKNFKEASQLAMAGKWVDISALVPVSDGKFKLEEAELQSQVQDTFDCLTRRVRSPEYAEFLDSVEAELGHITGLTVVSDLEFVLVFRCDNEFYENYEENPTRIYLLDPYIYHIYRTLMQRGNKFLFWTAAVRSVLDEIQAMLPDDMAGVPAICREDFWQIVCIFMKRIDEKISDDATMQEIRSVFAPFPERGYECGLTLFSKPHFLQEEIEQRKMDFAGVYKFPILLADPEHGVFIDDNADYITTAVMAKWPKERTIHIYPDLFSLREARKIVEGLRRIVPG